MSTMKKWYVQVPVLVTSQGPIFESNAIAKYGEYDNTQPANSLCSFLI